MPEPLAKSDTSTDALVSKVWGFCTTLRDDGVGYNGAHRAGDTGLGSGILATFADTLRAAWTVEHAAGTTVRMVVRNFIRA